MEGVVNFKFLGRHLDQTGSDWLAVRWNAKRMRRVWGRLENLLRREGEDPKVAKMFYRSVTQEVFLFVSETWILSAAMERSVEGTHTGFFRKIIGKWARRKSDGTWVNSKQKLVREAAVIQS